MNGTRFIANLRSGLGTAAGTLAIVLIVGLPALRGSTDDDLFGKPRAPSAKKKQPTDDRIDFKVSVSPEQAKPGQTLRLTITGIPRPGFHTYPITQRSADQEEVGLSSVEFEATPGLKPLWPITESDPELVPVEGLGQLILEYDRPFTWNQDILVLSDAPPGPKTLKFRIKLQVCNASTCVWGEPSFDKTITVTGPAVPLSAELKERLEAKPPKIRVVPTDVGQAPTPGPTQLPEITNRAPPPAEPVKTIPAKTFLITDSEANYRTSLEAIQEQITASQAESSSGLLAFMLTGVFWGAVSLLTPCVFPMIPITVSFFLKQSEKAHYRPLAMAVVYCLTIVVVLTIAAVALLSFFRWLSINPIMNFALGGLFVFFALSLFGMYDIELPTALTRFTSAREGKGGLIGVMFMALTFTIVSFACVAPFLGGFGGSVAGASGGWDYRLLGGLAFAVTFASPFFVLALFPNLLRQLPKSGSWLNSVKVVMGFLELAAALKFFRAGELILIPTPTFFTYDLVLGMWIALALLCGLYLLNFYRLPYDSPADNISVPRLLFGFLFLSLGFYLMPALFESTPQGENQRPHGAVYAWIDSFLLPEPSEGAGELTWSGDLPKAIDAARAAGTGTSKLVFVDFTGETCTNCKLNEKNVFSKSDIKKLFRSYGLVQMFTDKVPDKYYSADLRAGFKNSTKRQTTDAQTNLAFQRETFGTEQLPLYVILRPLPNGKVKVVDRYDEGKINSESAFAEFLKRPFATEEAARVQAR
jgi:thiol:disulfide interchange protein DsbD